MKKTGLEVVRLWIYWRWHERTQGVFFFDDLDDLFRLAEKHSLFIHPLLFLESAPEWFIRRFPQTWLVDYQRRSHYPLNRKSTQIGGMAVCCNHPMTKRYAGRFLRELVRRYKSRPSLLCWDVWNELQTKSVAGVCACECCLTDYRDYMRVQYRSLSALNGALHTCYGTWDDVVPPNGDCELCRMACLAAVASLQPQPSGAVAGVADQRS